MRVLQLIDSLEAGGAERIAVTYANELSCKLDSFICTTRSEGVLKNMIDKKVGYLFLNKNKTLDFKAFLKLRTFVVKEEIQIIQAHSSSFFLATLVKISKPSVKLIWHDHYGKSEHLNKRKSLALKYCSFFFKGIISVNTTLKNWAIKELNCKEVIYLPNFVSVKKDHKLKTVLKGAPGKRIVCLANLREQKDHINLLTAYKEVMFKYPGWTLHLIGKDFDDSYSKSVKDFITTNSLQNNVFIYGTCNDVDAILQNCQIGVLSSKSEGLPVSLLEYGKNKLPVLVTNVGECTEVVQNDITGLVVQKENTKEFANGLMKLIENENLRNSFSAIFHEHILQNYTEESVLKQIINCYQQTIRLS